MALLINTNMRTNCFGKHPEYGRFANLLITYDLQI